MLPRRRVRPTAIASTRNCITVKIAVADDNAIAATHGWLSKPERDRAPGVIESERNARRQRRIGDQRRDERYEERDDAEGRETVE